MKALQTHAQMLEPSLGFFENEWSVLLQFLLGQGYKLSIRVNGFFVIRPGEDACFSRCLNLLEIVNEALACNARCQQSSCQKLYAKQGDRKAVWKQIHSGIERERMFLKLQRHLSKQEGVLAKHNGNGCVKNGKLLAET